MQETSRTSRGATGKPLSFLFTDPRAHMTLPDPADCPHTERTFKAGAWTCKRCGAPRD